VDLNSMRLQEGHEGKDVIFCIIHERGELGKLLTQLIGDIPPLCCGTLPCVLCEDGVDHCQYHLSLSLSRMH